MSRHPDSELIRRMLCGPIGSATLNELADPADNSAGHISDRLSVCPDGEPAPAVAITPCPTAGAFINTPVHGERCGN